jgi:hypothetical protein
MSPLRIKPGFVGSEQDVSGALCRFSAPLLLRAQICRDKSPCLSAFLNLCTQGFKIPFNSLLRARLEEARPFGPQAVALMAAATSPFDRPDLRRAPGLRDLGRRANPRSTTPGVKTDSSRHRPS